MNSKNKQYISHLSYKVFIYGIYAVLCHAAAIWVYSDYLCRTSSHVFLRIFLPLFQYSLMSFALVIAGGLLCDIVVKRSKKA